MAGSKAGIVTHINEIESHAHLTHCHCYVLQSAIGQTIKAIKIMRGTLDATFELNKLIKYLYGLKIIKKSNSLKREGPSNRLREDTGPGNSGDRVLCSNHWTVRGTLL